VRRAGESSASSGTTASPQPTKSADINGAWQGAFIWPQAWDGLRNGRPIQATSKRSGLSSRLEELTRPVADLEEGLLASATYDGSLRVAVLKFYDSKGGRFWLWRDNTGHRPYCLTKLPREELESVGRRKDVIRVEEEEKLDLLKDEKMKLRKIIVTDPLAIGGGQNSIRDEIKAWEADIKYYENFAYDRGLKMGTYYRISSGKVIPVKHPVPENVARSLSEILSRNPPEFTPYLTEWAELLGEPLVDFKRVAMDIEVDNEEGRVPDPEDPAQPVIAVSFYNETEKSVFALAKEGQHPKPPGLDLKLFENETDLLRAVFTRMLDYPVILTFNGDNFDLRYLRHRAEKLGIPEDEDPIELQRVESSVKHGIHLDLYNFFKNRSIQVYAFSNKYSDYTLNTISESLLGKSKIPFEGNVGDLPLEELARYNLNDSQLTYELTTMGGSVAMKLLLVIARIGKMPMNDVGRLGVSNWIRSMLFFEHRKMGALIPRQDELSEKGGASSQATIKGKKYKGGLVIEPKPGVYFDVSVLDFASLYPSLIKIHNLSYETVNCPHEECKKNQVPGTTSWVCTKRKGIESLVTGSLRDLRVGHYKPLTKVTTLSADERELYNIVSQGLKVILNACFTGDTYVVTPSGTKNIRDFRVGDSVINVNPETLQVEVDRVTEVQAFPYKGQLIHFKDRRFIDLMVTPNHRFLTKDRRKSSETGVLFRTAEEIYQSTNIAIPKLSASASDLSSTSRISMLETATRLGAVANVYPPRHARLINWYRELEPSLRTKIRQKGSAAKYRNKITKELESHYKLPASALTEMDIDSVETLGGRVLLGEHGCSKIPARFDVQDFASLCGWFVSEGSPHLTEAKAYSNGNYRGRTASIVITQGYGRGNPRGVIFRAEIKQLLDRMRLVNIRDANDNKYYKVTSSILTRWLTENCYTSETAHNAFTKKVPSVIYQSRAAMTAFLEAAYKGDGSRRQTRYSTASLRLAQDMVVLLSYLGNKVKMTYEEGVYRLVFKNVSSKLTYSGGGFRRHVARIPYDGTVYCVTTERNHTVIAGRNGRFVHVGQSYGVMGFETFAFYCLPVAEATAALGRDAITRTIERCHEAGISVVYSDTDSLFLQNPSKDQIATVTRWAESDLGVELDLDKTYRYVAFSSRKKNYFGVFPDGTVDIKGLTGKKSMTPEYLKKIFYDSLEILTGVRSPDDFERARARIRELLTKMVNDLKGRKVPVMDLAFNVMMGKPTTKYNGTTPQHVRAAQRLEESGKEIKAGDIIQYVKTKTPPYVKPAEQAKPDDIDPDKYIEYARSMFDQMLDALDFSFDEIMGATTLDLFWS
jgi:DNA polymerase elongation subunit (family B)